MLFCDVVGSTALGESVDPEALQGLLARYFERMKAIVESHGGSVEKFIGDAVMAVFGVPAVHEDDALRACRAAIEMREAFPELGDPGTDRSQHRRGRHRHRGAARDRRRGQRRRAAAAGGRPRRDPDRRERRSSSSVARSRSKLVEPLELKGKAEPVSGPPADLRPGGARALARVALRRPRARGRAASRGVAAGRSAPAAASSSRSSATRESASQRVVCRSARRDRSSNRPRPLPPLRRGHHLLAGGRGDQAARRPALRPGRGSRDPLAPRSDEPAASPEEIAWAFRKLLEEQAPLVVVFDDIQWGEETFLDLVEGVALLSLRRADPARLHGASGAPLEAERLADRASARAVARGRQSRS